MGMIGVENVTALGSWSGSGCEGALASLAGETLSKRFCAWRGAADRRYIASVFEVEPAAADAGLPAFDTCVLMAVAHRDGGRRILFARPIERPGDRFAAIARGRAERVTEWHVHFLADSPRMRLAAAEDLARRHIADVQTDVA